MPLTADALLTLNVSTQLANSPAATSTILHDGTIRIVSTLPNAVPPSPPDTIPAYEGCDLNTSVCCDPTGGASLKLTFGSELVAWATHIQNTQTTEDEFQTDIPDDSELSSLPSTCADTIQVGTPPDGICTCPAVPAI